jgi:hypothetical protein
MLQKQSEDEKVPSPHAWTTRTGVVRPPLPARLWKRNKRGALKRQPRMRTELHFVMERVAGFTPRPHLVEE